MSQSIDSLLYSSSDIHKYEPSVAQPLTPGANNVLIDLVVDSEIHHCCIACTPSTFYLIDVTAKVPVATDAAARATGFFALRKAKKPFFIHEVESSTKIVMSWPSPVLNTAHPGYGTDETIVRVLGEAAAAAPAAAPIDTEVPMGDEPVMGDEGQAAPTQAATTEPEPAASEVTSACIVGQYLYFTIAHGETGLLFRTPFADVVKNFVAERKDDAPIPAGATLECVNLACGLPAGPFRLLGAAQEPAEVFFVTHAESLDTWLLGHSAAAPKKLKLTPKKYADFFAIRYGAPFAENVGMKHILTPALLAQLKTEGIDTENSAAVVEYVHAQATAVKDRHLVGGMVDAQNTPWLFTSAGECVHCPRSALDLNNLFLDKKGFACLARAQHFDQQGREVANFRMRDASWDTAISHGLRPWSAVYFDALHVSRAKERAGGRIVDARDPNLTRVGQLPEGHGCVAAFGCHEDTVALSVYLSNSLATISVPGDTAVMSKAAPAAPAALPDGVAKVEMLSDFTDASGIKRTAGVFNKVFFDDEHNMLVFPALVTPVEGDPTTKLMAVLL